MSNIPGTKIAEDHEEAYSMGFRGCLIRQISPLWIETLALVRGECVLYVHKLPTYGTLEICNDL
jgi:hypothetical protein